MKRLCPTALTLVLFALGCGSDPMGPPPRITALPRALTPQEQSLIQADNRLAIKLLQQVNADTRDTMPNLFISPLSVAMALGMTYNGAATTTADAMRATLELEGLTVPEVNESYRSLIALLRGLDPHVKFQIANSIWYDLQLAVEQSFVAVNRTYFDAQVASLDFRSPTAAQTINNWVDEHTNRLIHEIVSSPLPTDALMFLINAIYFKGDWTQQFNKELTAPRPFRLADGSTVNVPTMTFGNEAPIRTAWTPEASVIDLPYGGSAFSMTILLPRDTVTVDGLLARLTLDNWNSAVAALDATEAELFLPKFKLENNLSLKGTLMALGMGIAFSDFADFSGIRKSGGLTIYDVKHRTYVDVDEEGTTAAAVTAVVIGPTSVGPPRILVDRPFLFALRENLSGTILFMGVIRQPPTS